MDHLATFALFVRHGRPLESRAKEKELRALFAGYGTVVSFETHRGWNYSIVAFSSTAEASRAKTALHNSNFQRQRLNIRFMKPTRCVLVRGFPDHVDESAIEDAFQRAFRVKRLGKEFLVHFALLSDAAAAVAKANFLGGGCQISCNFEKERRNYSRRRSFSESPDRASIAAADSTLPSRKRSRSPAATATVAATTVDPRPANRKVARQRSQTSSKSPSPAYCLFCRNGSPAFSPPSPSLLPL